MNPRLVGNEYEERAVKYLVSQGFQIVERNFTIRGGEIDIVARDNNYLVFVEVRFRKSGLAAESIGKMKKMRICRAAHFYLMKRAISPDSPIRFDVILINANGIEHIPNAFSFYSCD